MVQRVLALMLHAAPPLFVPRPAHSPGPICWMLYTPCLPSHPPLLSAFPPCAAEPDLQPIFEPFGPLDFVRLQRDATGQATGIGFVQ